jgi:5S rRNA maturation endonuclease (ribonuclease M5)
LDNSTILKRLQESNDISDIATILGYQKSKLTYILYSRDYTKYKKFYIPKKSGGVREICAPDKKLKFLQSKLAEILYECSNVIEQNSNRDTKAKHIVSHGFCKGLSIASNARQHINKRFVLNIDLEDFSPTINFGRVRGFFIKNKNFRLKPAVATIIAQIACFNNGLPQGSPVSPIISNLIASKLDKKILELSKKYKLVYSRYADDLTFSTNNKIFPVEFAYEHNPIILKIFAKLLFFKKNIANNKWIVGNELKQCILSSGYRINNKKTRISHRTSQQTVTGLTVNKVVNIRKGYYKYARAMCHSLFKTGNFVFPASVANRDLAKFNSEEIEKKILRLHGILSHIYYIKNYRNICIKNEQGSNRKASELNQTIRHEKTINPNNQYGDNMLKKHINGIENLYSRFLFFTNFIHINKPTILTEGKTDIIYLTYAIKSLRLHCPLLVEDNKLKVRFLKHTDSKKVLIKWFGGTGNLCAFPNAYFKSKTIFDNPMSHPIIVIVDGDSAGDKVQKEWEENLKLIQIKAKECWQIEGSNLFLLQLPLLNNQATTTIEDYFDDELKNSKLSNGTSFKQNPEGNKYLFATEVVQEQQHTIDFSKFTVVLNTLQQLIQDFYTSNTNKI